MAIATVDTVVAHVVAVVELDRLHQRLPLTRHVRSANPEHEKCGHSRDAGDADTERRSKERIRPLRKKRLHVVSWRRGPARKVATPAIIRQPAFALESRRFRVETTRSRLIANDARPCCCSCKPSPSRPRRWSASTPARCFASSSFRSTSVQDRSGALGAALTLQKRFDSEVHLFRLTQSTENDQFLAGTGASLSPQELVTSAEERLRRFVDNVLPGRAAEVIVHANVGADVIHSVARAAKHIGATLALIPAESRHRLFRTTTEKLVLELDCPVLLVAGPERSRHSLMRWGARERMCHGDARRP